MQLLAIDQVMLRNVEVEISGMAYGFPTDGILGIAVLTTTGALIDWLRLPIEFASVL